MVDQGAGCVMSHWLASNGTVFVRATVGGLVSRPNSLPWSDIADGFISLYQMNLKRVSLK